MALERELKFSVAPRAALHVAQALALPARGTRLTSIYFDTADGELHRARLALRLRRDGHQWLQTVKSQTGLARRGEWEAPAPAKRLALAALPCAEVLAATGVDLRALAGRLKPAFETRFTRRARQLSLKEGTVEIALDQGFVFAGRRREPVLELELELKRGSMQPLLEHAETLVEPLALKVAFESKAERGYRLARGEALPAPRKWRTPEFARDASTGAVMVELVSAALEQIGANAHCVLHCDDAEYLHQLRVGMRRLRAALSAFKPLAQAKGLRRRLRRLAPSLGAARDWDVFLSWLERNTASSPVLNAARERQKLARRAARAVLESAAFDLFLLRGLRWSERKADAKAAPLPGFATRVLQRLLERTLKQARRMDWQSKPERHALRIRVKRLRYVADALAPLFAEERAKPYLAALEGLQERLGQLNDAALGARLLDELGGDERLERKLEAQERRLVQALMRDWRAFEKRRPFWAARK